MKRNVLGQVTATVVALAVVIMLLPAAAKAGKFLEVFVTDPVDTTHQARVDESGAVHVGDGAGPLTVDGTVGAQPALAQTSLLDTVSLDSQSPGGSPADRVFGQLFAPGQKVALTSLTVTNRLDNAFVSTIVLQALQPHSGECGGLDLIGVEVGPQIFIAVGPKETKHLAFPYPLVVPSSTPGGDWCLRAFVFGHHRVVSVTAVGYLP